MRGADDVLLLACARVIDERCQSIVECVVVVSPCVRACVWVSAYMRERVGSDKRSRESFCLQQATHVIGTSGDVTRT
jgi:hypothetical protein